MDNATDFTRYAESVRDELLDFLRAFAPIPAPSHNEDRRVAFLLDALPKMGIEGAYVDDAKNVVIPYGVDDGKDVIVAMAHTDVVFPDVTPLPFSEDETTIHCPGIGDDTTQLAQLLFAFRYFVSRGIRPKTGIVFVANSCEEGLGNLAGSRAICEAFKGRIRAFVSVDSSCGNAYNRAVGSHRYKVTVETRGGHSWGNFANRAVGSHRYRVTVETRGGHSWGNFGNRNAIAEAAGMIRDFYAQKVPEVEGQRTTYNVGLISGGTSVNTIAQKAEFLYEYRSTDRGCLSTMKDSFEAIIASHRSDEVKIAVDLVGERPCSGDVDKARQGELEAMANAACRAVFGKNITFKAASTDANIPLSLGIPSLTVGAVVAPGAHTREERLEKSSLVPGLTFLLHFFGKLFDIAA